MLSWTTCLYLFNYPERPRNYDWLRKLGRLEPIKPFPALEAPTGSAADPRALYEKYAPLDDKQLAALNLYLLRNYVTNYKEVRFTTYLEGDFRILSSRSLTGEDFFQPGILLSLQGQVALEEIGETGPYPIFVDLLLPVPESFYDSSFEPGHLLTFRKITHRAAVLHVSQTEYKGEPAYRLTAIPLSYENYQTGDQKPLPLAAPDPLNLSTSLDLDH